MAAWGCCFPAPFWKVITPGSSVPCSVGCGGFRMCSILQPTSALSLQCCLFTPKGEEIWTDQVPFLIAATVISVPAPQPRKGLGGVLGDYSLSSYQSLKYCVPSCLLRLEMQVNIDCYCGDVNLVHNPQAGRFVLFIFPLVTFFFLVKIRVLVVTICIDLWVGLSQEFPSGINIF